MMFSTLESALFICAAILLVVHSHPAPPEDPKESPKKENLKYTFGSKEEIPAAFFEHVPPKKNVNETDTSTRSPQERQVYPACQDGSGGMCVETGTCPTDLKPEANVPGACASGQECCFGPPSTDRSCSSRGGECRSTAACGSAPKYAEAVDCDKRNDEVCCILI